jgi:hypothetical protein
VGHGIQPQPLGCVAVASLTLDLHYERGWNEPPMADISARNDPPSRFQKIWIKANGCSGCGSGVRFGEQLSLNSPT